MALVVETGAGLTNAESYASVADADAYFTARQGSSTWTAASTASKEEALRNATTYLDLKYNGRWRGLRATDDQSLDFPRSYISDRDGYAIGSDEIPTRLKYGTIEAALQALSEDLMPDLVADEGIVREENVAVGPVRSHLKYQGASRTKYYRRVHRYVLEFLKPRTLVERA